MGWFSENNLKKYFLLSKKCQNNFENLEFISIIKIPIENKQNQALTFKEKTNSI